MPQQSLSDFARGVAQLVNVVGPTSQHFTVPGQSLTVVVNRTYD